MARFKYRMQSLLDIKSKLETQAKQEFAAAKMALDIENERLEELKKRKAFYEAEAEALLHGALQVQKIRDSKTAVLKMEDYIVIQKQQIRVAEAKVEAARQKLTGLMQERKMHEKLKEHAFEAFMQDEKKREGKEVDELTSYTYGQRIQEREKRKG